MKRRKIFSWLCGLLILCLLPIGAFATDDPPSQAGERKLEGGQRDFKWPVPGRYNLTSCFLDNRNHYSLDIDGEIGDTVIASYAGTVIGTDTRDITTGWGNFVLLEHSYTLKGGQIITLYSRYAHLEDVTVSVGQSVTAGQKIGTVGSTGKSTGSHLDYDILYGGTYPSSTYSVDPYINELLELPEELYTTFGQCCREYVAYVKKLYPQCAHEVMDALGKCSACGYTYNWKITRDVDAMGYYTVSARTEAMSVPYQQDGGTLLPTGEKVSVAATVINGFGKTWYEVSLSDGTTGYVPEETLTFQGYFDSLIEGSLSTLEDGQVLKQASHRIDGRITSRYPLRKLNGYLDGQWYTTWSVSGSDRTIELRSTSINKELSFSALTPGKHTLTITASDSTGRETVQIITCTFQIVENAVTYTVTFTGLEKDTAVTVEEGKTLGELPVPVKEGQCFTGWFTEDGQEVTGETVPTADMTLYPKWKAIVLTTEPQSTASTAPANSQAAGTEPETTQPSASEAVPPEQDTGPVAWWLFPAVTLVILGGAGGFFFIRKRNNARALF